MQILLVSGKLKEILLKNEDKYRNIFWFMCKIELLWNTHFLKSRMLESEPGVYHSCLRKKKSKNSLKIKITRIKAFDNEW